MSSTPKVSWVQASADFCGPCPTGETVLVVIDAHSKCAEVEIIKSTAAKEVLPAMERIFATHGLPKTLKSDDGPPFQGQASRSFAEEKGFKHQKITPLWPEANSRAEGFMKNIDKVAKTAHSEGKDWRRQLYIFLGNYRATPHHCAGKTPYELSMNRIVRSKLPSFTQVSPDPEVQKKDQDSKARMKAYADTKRSTKNLMTSTLATAP